MRRRHRYLAALAIFATLATLGAMAGSDTIYQPLDPVIDGASGTNTATTSGVIQLMESYKPTRGSLQLEVTGTGTVSYVEFLASNDKTNFVPAFVLISGSVYTNRFFESYTTNSGAGTDGKGFVWFDLPPAVQAKIKLNRTNGISAASCWLTVQ